MALVGSDDLSWPGPLLLRDAVNTCLTDFR